MHPSFALYGGALEIWQYQVASTKEIVYITDPMIIQIISVKLRYSITLLFLNLVNT